MVGAGGGVEEETERGPETVKEGREPEEATRSGLMARIKHPADVFSGACTRGIASDFRWPSTVRRWREGHRVLERGAAT